MISSLEEEFARRVPIRDIDRVTSGSPVAFVLKVRDGRLRDARTVPAVLALARRHMPMLRAKRTVEAVVKTGRSHG